MLGCDRGTARVGTRGRRTLAAALAVGTIVALSACTSARNAPAPTPAASPVKGGTVTYAVALDAQPDGIFKTLERNNAWIDNVFEPILLNQPNGQDPKPVLAKSWKLADDRLSIDIVLRGDVTFHTGRQMTADDVKHTYEEAALPESGSQLGFVAKAFTDMTVVSPTELKITFSSPQGSLFDFLDQTLIVDKDTEAGLKDGSKVIGTGPFTFSDWRPGASYTLKKYKSHWDADKVNLDSIEYVVTTDATAELSALRSGRAQVGWGLTASDAKSFAGNKFSILDAGGSMYYLGMNVTVAPFDNQKVRQAVAYAIDSGRINDQVLAGTGTVTDLAWGKNTPGVDESLTGMYAYDAAKAKKMIADAGATGAAVPVSYNGSNPVVKAMYEVIANNLTAAGLAPTPVTLDQPTFQSKLATLDLGATYASLTGQVGLSPATLLNALPPIRSKNVSHFASPENDKLRQAVLTASTGDEKAKALKALSTYMLDQEWLKMIVQAPSEIVVATSVQAVDLSVRGPVLLGHAYIAK